MKFRKSLLYGCLSILVLLFSAPSFVRGENEVSIKTDCCGDIKAVVVGPENGTPVIAIHGMKESMAMEWMKVASKLGDEGFRVCVLNLHSNPKTKPKAIDKAEMQKILLDSVTKGYFNTDKAILMGKSWGGSIAANYAANHPTAVSKLVLVAPALGGDKALSAIKDRTQHLPVYLAWAKDDRIMPAKRTDKWIDVLGDRLTTLNKDSGGHVIFDEYAPSIAAFLKHL